MGKKRERTRKRFGDLPDFDQCDFGFGEFVVEEYNCQGTVNVIINSNADEFWRRCMIAIKRCKRSVRIIERKN